MKFVLQAILAVLVAMTPITAAAKPDDQDKFPFPIGTGPYNPFPDDFDGLSIGQVHNMAVQYYYDTADDEEGGRMLKQTPEKKIAKTIKAMYKFAVKSGYMKEQDANAMMADYDFGIKGKKFLGYKVIESHLNNPALEKGIADVVAKTESGASLEEVIEAVVAEVTPFADAGNVQAQVFVDVLTNSLDYWTNKAGSNRKLLKESSEVIAADAVGALHGLILGPVVSIIEGAVVSIAKNEGWF